MEQSIQKYKHFGECFCVTNGILELKIPIFFGIRIIYCAIKGRENIFYEQPAGDHFLTAKNGWRVYGGHRLWLAPESEKSYFPDNQEISFQIKDDVLTVEQPVDSYLNIVKSMEIKFSEEDPAVVMVRHKAVNMNEYEISTALWTVSAMAGGAAVKIPFAGESGGYNPNRNLSLWGATKLSDSRLRFENKSIIVGHRPVEDYFKLGLWCGEGHLSCKSNGHRVSKYFDVIHGRSYPDNSVNVEVFQCREMMEIELLGPVEQVGQGAEIVFSECWRIV